MHVQWAVCVCVCLELVASRVYSVTGSAKLVDWNWTRKKARRSCAGQSGVGLRVRYRSGPLISFVSCPEYGIRIWQAVHLPISYIMQAVARGRSANVSGGGQPSSNVTPGRRRGLGANERVQLVADPQCKGSS